MTNNTLLSEFYGAKYIKAANAPSAYSLYDPVPLFRKEFDIDLSRVESAEIVVQSPGFGCYYINGKNITDDVFISAFSDYSKILWYNKYDVTALLKNGKNTLGVIVGNGFFNEPFETVWKFNEAGWRDAPQFLLCLKINGEPYVLSDGSWKCSLDASPIIFSHLRSGEYFDARRNDPAWMTEGFDDSSWMPAIVRDSSEITAHLMLTECQPIRENEVIAPIAITETDKGYLFDFGVNSSGYAEFTLEEARDTEITFRYAEEVDENLYPKHNRMDLPYFYPESPFMVNKLIASGGIDTFKPRFSYHGFRYVLVEGLSKKPSPESAKAYFVHQDVARRSTFESGNDILNFIYKAGIRSAYSNMFWCLTDCPTREKFGWTNDAAASLERMLIDFDIVPLLKKWFEDTKVSQREDGAIPGIIPTYGWGFDWGPVCDTFIYELPYRVYVYTKDSSMLKEGIPLFLNYIKFLENARAEDYQFKLGDWKGKGKGLLVPKEFIWDFYLMKAYYVTSVALRLAGEDASEIDAKRTAAKEAFILKYLDSDGRCTVAEQCSVAMMIMGGYYADLAPLAEQLVEVMERDNMELSCGMVGVQYLYEALAKIGRAELAYKMITESDPGYKTWYDAGATTLWEIFAGHDRDSHNHHMFSNIISWFYRALLGIVPDENHPAFERIELKPCFIKDLGFVKGSEETVKGRIDAEWKYENGAFLYKITVPEGIDASFDGKKLNVGENTFAVKE